MNAEEKIQIYGLSKLFELLEECDLDNELIIQWHNYKANPTNDVFRRFHNTFTIENFIALYEYFLDLDHGKSFKYINSLVDAKFIPFNLGDILKEHSTYTTLRREHIENKDVSENDLASYLLNSICKIENIVLSKKEYVIDGIGRIDLYGKTDSGRDVIIECKLRNKNPNRQLLAYAAQFNDPILIGVTEYPIIKKYRLPCINYFTYYELGVTLKEWQDYPKYGTHKEGEWIIYNNSTSDTNNN
jgi:hypothetical protein